MDNSTVKKYLVVMTAVFVLTMLAIVVATNVLDKKNGDENGVFSWANIRDSFRVDKDTIEDQRKAVDGDGTVSPFLSDTETEYITDSESGTVRKGEDTEFFHAAIFTEKDIQTRNNLGLTDEAVNAACKQNEGRYCYDIIDDSLKQLYGEVYLATVNRMPDAPLCTREQTELDYIYRCVLNDHPEIFSVFGYKCVVHSANGKPVKTVYNAKYTMTQKEEAVAQKQIDAYTDAFLLGISKTASEYEKVKYTYCYLIQNTEYELESPENQNICSVMIYHKTVCLGYAKAFQYLLERLGVSSTVVEGVAASGEAHAWNMVSIDNAYYFVDVTWGDSSYTNGQSVVRMYSGVNFDYLNITTDELAHSHTIDNVVPIPRCVEIKDNYYVREGLYFDHINSAELSLVFQKAQANNEDYITLKCANDTAYQEMRFYLLDEQKVFDYLPAGTEKLNYGENQELHTLTFLLK
ncbi:MAG: hypothetical protein IKI20_00115 [Lachnospiraceae bacterium]|nr:hypothetical protein [Lachnospiraceae bacterium]